MEGRETSLVRAAAHPAWGSIPAERWQADSSQSKEAFKEEWTQ
jgi:hypothetical protein